MVVKLFDIGRELARPKGPDSLVDVAPLFILFSKKKCSRTSDGVDALSLRNIHAVGVVQDVLEVPPKLEETLFSVLSGVLAGVATGFWQTWKARADWYFVNFPMLDVIRVLDGP